MACFKACLGRLGEGKIGEAFVFIVLRVLEPRRQERSKRGHRGEELTSSSTACWSFSTSTSLRLRFWARCSFLTLVGLVRPVSAPAMAVETGEKTIGVELDRGFGWSRCSDAQELLVHGSLGGRRGTERPQIDNRASPIICLALRLRVPHHPPRPLSHSPCPHIHTRRVSSPTLAHPEATMADDKDVLDLLEKESKEFDKVRAPLPQFAP